MANWYSVEPQSGIQAITDHVTTAQHGLGKVMRAKDDSTSGQGEGEFIYLLGVTGTTAGKMVTYNATTFQTALTANTANLNAPIAIAMSACVGSEYGWYQIGGYAVVSKVTGVTVTPQVALYQSSTTGSVTSLAASGKQFRGMKSANLTTVASATTTVAVIIDRPQQYGAAA